VKRNYENQIMFNVNIKNDMIKLHVKYYK